MFERVLEKAAIKNDFQMLLPNTLSHVEVKLFKSQGKTWSNDATKPQIKVDPKRQCCYTETCEVCVFQPPEPL